MEQDALLRKLAEAVDAWRMEAGEQTRRIQSGLTQVQEQVERVAEALAVEDEREFRARGLLADTAASPADTIAQLRGLLAATPAPGGPRLALLERCIARWSKDTGASLREFAAEMHAAAMQFERLESVLPPIAREADESSDELRERAAEQEALAAEFRSTAEHAIHHADALEIQVEDLREALARERAELDAVRQQLDAAETRHAAAVACPDPGDVERLKNELDEVHARNDRLELRISDADDERRAAEVTCESLRRELEAAQDKIAEITAAPAATDDPDRLLVAAALDAANSEADATDLPGMPAAEAEALRLELESARAFLADAARTHEALEAECARLREREQGLAAELESLRDATPNRDL